MNRLIKFSWILLIIAMSSCKHNLGNNNSTIHSQEEYIDSLDNTTIENLPTDSIVLINDSVVAPIDSQIIVKAYLAETNDSNEIVRTHESIPDLVGKLGKAYFIESSSNSIVDSLTISRYMLGQITPWIKDISEFEIASFNYLGNENDQYNFYIWMCKPDTDDCYGYFYHHSAKGDSLVIDESIWDIPNEGVK